MKYSSMTWGHMEAVVNIIGGMEGVERLLRGEVEVVEKKKINRLDYISVHNILPTTIPLTCDRSFAEKMVSKFKDMFIGKVEEPQPEMAIKRHRLDQSSTALEIATDLDDRTKVNLDGKTQVKTTLTVIKGLMSAQANGEAGILHTNGWLNIFFVEDKEEVLRMVYVLWFEGGWLAYALSLEDQDVLKSGSLVFCCISTS